MRVYHHIILGILICLSLLGCVRQASVRQSYTIVVRSPVEALPFLAQTESKGWNYDWQVVIAKPGSVDAALGADFYVLDFFEFYALHDNEEQFLEQRALFSTYTDSALVVRQEVSQQPLATWRFGMSNGDLSDYLLDYLSQGTNVERLQVKDDAQGVELLQAGVIDAMILASAYAQELVDSGDFVIKWRSAEEGLRLSVVVPSQMQMQDDEIYWRIVQDYRYGLELLSQDEQLLASIIGKDQYVNLLVIDPQLPFLLPEEFNDLRTWRMLQIPFSASWSYENLLWVPKEDS